MPRALEMDEIPISSRSSDPAPSGRCVRVSTASRFTARTAICPINSCRTGPTSVPTSTAARSSAPLPAPGDAGHYLVWGADRVGVRIAPSGSYGSMSDSDPAATFGYVTTQLDRLGIGYLHVVEPRIKGTEEISHGRAPIAAQHLRPKFSRTLIAAGGFAPESAEAIVAAGDADLVAFGRYFISNPDLPERLRRGLPLNRYDRSTFYGGDARGYVDYPAAEVASAA